MRRALVAVLVMASGCSAKHLDGVGITYEPPSKFDFIGLEPGPPPRAQYAHGLSVTRFATEPPQLGDDSQRYGEQLAEIAGLGSGWSATLAHGGTIPAGPCVKVEMDRGGTAHAMHYVIPRAHGFVLLSYVAPGSDTVQDELKLEQSLARLKVDP